MPPDDRGRRRLPSLWHLFVAVMIAPALVLGVTGLGRYAAETFPIFIALAGLLDRLPRWVRPVYFATSAAGLALCGMLVNRWRLRAGAAVTRPRARASTGEAELERASRRASARAVRVAAVASRAHRRTRVEGARADVPLRGASIECARSVPRGGH